MTNSSKFEDRLTMQVSPRIIQLISSGLYRSPASAIKELISNAFDADAGEVAIKFKFDYNRGSIILKTLSVEDDGDGMDLKDLKYAFGHIGGSIKTIKKGEKTHKGRNIIGNLGIGMLAIASACRSFKIRTKKRDEQREYTADISLAFFDNVQAATETMDKFSIGNVIIKSAGIESYDHYTKIEIEDFRPPFLAAVLNDLGNSFLFQNKLENENGDENIYEKYFEGFIDHIYDKKKMGNLQQLDEIVATLGLIASVQYLSDGPVKSVATDIDGELYNIPGTSDPEYIKLKDRLRDLGFNVFLEFDVTSEKRNYFKLYKPLLYPNDEDIKSAGGIKNLDPYVSIIPTHESELETEAHEIENISIGGYVYHQNARILPHEYRGILYRVFNVAIGDKFADDLRLYSENPIILHQMLMEVYLNEGFRRVVNLDRESFYEGSRAYMYLRAYLNNSLKGEVPSKPSYTEKAKKTENDDGDNPSRKKENEDVPKEAPTEYHSDKFYDMLIEKFKPKKGMISEIKERQTQLRREKLKRKDSYQTTLEIFKEKTKSEPIISKTTNKSEYGKIINNKDGKSELKLPPFEGSRKKLWESIFIIVSIWVQSNDDARLELMDALYTIYKIAETGKNA